MNLNFMRDDVATHVVALRWLLAEARWIAGHCRWVDYPNLMPWNIYEPVEPPEEAS